MKNIKELIFLKFTLLTRTNYEKKENINFLLIIFLVSILLFYFSYSSKDILLNLSSCYLIIGSIYYQSTKDKSFISFTSLNLIVKDKKKYFYYNLVSEITTKLSLVILLLFTGVFDSFQLVLYFLISNCLFISVCYLAAEVSRLDRFYYYIFRGITLFPLIFFLEGFDKFILKSQSFLGALIDSHIIAISMVFIGIQMAIILLMSRILYKKVYS
jgi:hypothetical protein